MKGGIISSKGNYNDLRKTARSNFVMQKNQSSMMMMQQQQQEVISGKKAAGQAVEFPPVSPQLMYGEEMVHFSHPRHGPLSHICLPDLFTCSGCKEYGAGKRFSCQQCDFQLHDFCAFSPQVLKAHPFHSHHQLLFYAKPPNRGIMQSKCDVCSKPVKGFAFRCGVCTFQMHPCCAMLSTEINMPSVHLHKLRMLPASGSGSGSAGAGAGAAGAPGSSVLDQHHQHVYCSECKKRRSGRVYRCTVCEYQVHAACVKSVKNGLRENGHKGNEKASVLGEAARVVTQVVVEFLGGIIEGLGEGVGEALVQNINGKAAPSPLRHRPN